MIDSINEILSSFPDLEPSQWFTLAIGAGLPLHPAGAAHGAQQVDEVQETEAMFKRFMQAVRKHYPDSCRDNGAWVRAGAVLLIRYGNLLATSPISWTAYRQEVFIRLYHRFEAALQTVANKFQKSLKEIVAA